MTTPATLRRRVRYIECCIALLPAAAGAQARIMNTGGVLQSGALTFSAHATVGDFTGSTTAVTGAWTGDLSGASGWVEAPVATLVTHNDHRDRDLRASMEVEKYPTMRFELARTARSPQNNRADADSVILYGMLAIHGVTRAVVIPASAQRTGDTIHVRSSFPLDLREYQIGGLSKMFGLLRMEPIIQVNVDLRFIATSSLNAVVSQP